MTYSVKEIFYSLQGEGAQSGRPAIFCRFAGCNLWSGREEDRAEAECTFCDTDFVGTDGENGGRFSSPDDLKKVLISLWPDLAQKPFVVFTGGEPLLQLDQALCETLHLAGFEIAIETNGTLPLEVAVDWVCVSPKAGQDLVLTQGDELKVIYPQEGLDLKSFEPLAFDHYYLQPMDVEGGPSHVQATMDYCLDNPCWKLSLQTHKTLGIQ